MKRSIPTQPPRFEFEAWGGGEYMVTRDHCPIGLTVCRSDAMVIVRWLNTPGLSKEIGDGPANTITGA